MLDDTYEEPLMHTCEVLLMVRGRVYAALRTEYGVGVIPKRYKQWRTLKARIRWMTRESVPSTSSLHNMRTSNNFD